MDYKRFFTFEPVIDNKIILNGDEFYHAAKVLRIKKGFKIIVNDNTDKDYYCAVESVGKNFLVAEIEKTEINPAYGDTDITLYIGICKELDTVVQKAVELGVTKLVPFSSQHTNIKNVNYDRLNRIILESSKQCGRPNLMSLGKLTSLLSAFEDADKEERANLLFYEYERENRIKDIDLSSAQKIALYIGGEGGFSVEEIQKAKQKGFNILTLGKRILRVPTAVVSALTLCLQGMDKL